MSEVRVEERRVAPGEWSDAVRAARDEGYAFFDWLAAVDETDRTAAEEGAPSGAPRRGVRRS